MTGTRARTDGTHARWSVDLERLWLAVSILGIAAGGVLSLAGNERAADVAWAITTAIGVFPRTRPPSAVSQL